MRGVGALRWLVLSPCAHKLAWTADAGAAGDVQAKGTSWMAWGRLSDRPLPPQTRALRATGDFPTLLWKDIPPQHFETIFGEYPAHKPKPPFTCYPVGLSHEPAPGQEKWRLRPDHTLEARRPACRAVTPGDVSRLRVRHCCLSWLAGMLGAAMAGRT